MKKKILALILAAVVFNTGIYYPADSYAYEGVDAVSAQMEDGTTGKEFGTGVGPYRDTGFTEPTGERSSGAESGWSGVG